MRATTPSSSRNTTHRNTNSSNSKNSVLFGSSVLNARRQYYNPDLHDQLENVDKESFRDSRYDESPERHDRSRRSTSTTAPTKGSLADFFFGFMYLEDEFHALVTSPENDDDDNESFLYQSSIVEPMWVSVTNWNVIHPIHAALFAALVLSTAAAAVPVTLASAITQQLHPVTANNSNYLATAAVIGSAVGKLINGPVPDLVGARRTACYYCILQAVCLMGLAAAPTPTAAAWAAAGIEFAYAVQWPAVVVVLASHARGNAAGMYESGIWICSLGARLGWLLGIGVSSVYLQLHNNHSSYTDDEDDDGTAAASSQWRWVALFAAWTALVASSVLYLHVTDSPGQTNDPLNPVNWRQFQKWFDTTPGRGRSYIDDDDDDNSALLYSYNYQHHQYTTSPTSTVESILRTMGRFLGMAVYIFQTNVWPSVQHIVRSGTFWVVAVAHTGACMVRTSERILGRYFYETSINPSSAVLLSRQSANGLAVCLTMGTVMGLLLAGNAFAAAAGERSRKWLVGRLYVASIIAVYVLAFLAIPTVRRWLLVCSPYLVTLLQVVAVTVAGFGIAVQYYHIPSLVGATSFGCDKGLFAAYTDGVGYGLASIVWNLVGDSISTTTTTTTAQSNNDGTAVDTFVGGGWAYGWAAVALLLILSAILMVEFYEHKFCRPRHGGSYETIIFA